MISKVTFIGYGRQVKTKDWYIAPISGVNRVHCIHSGQVIFRSGDKERIIREGMIYIFPQNLSFELICDETTLVDHTYYDFFSLPAIIMDDVLEIDPDKYPLISAAAKVLVELAGKEAKLYSELARSYMESFLETVNKEVGLELLDNTVISDAVEYIHNNFNKKISISEMAKKYHLEKSVFIRKFKKYTDTTPYQYIKNHRVNYAVSLIKNKGYSLSEIAEMSGYCDQAALSHAVKSTTGLYPEQISKKTVREK